MQGRIKTNPPPLKSQIIANNWGQSKINFYS